VIPTDHPIRPALHWRAESYFHVRVTDAEGAEPFTGLRRLRLNVTGESKQERVFVQFFHKNGFHQANDDRLWFQDVSYTRRTPHGNWSIGQLRPAFSRQRITGDQQLVVMDRTVAVDAIMPAGGFFASFARDVGVQWESPVRSGWLGSAGLFRGSGTAQQPAIGSGGPLWTARVLRRFAGGGMQWEGGIAGALRDNHSRDFSRAIPGLKGFRGRDTRIGFELTGSRGPWRGTAEWLDARFAGSGGSPSRHVDGGYVEVLRTIAPRTEAVLQFQTFDPDTSVVAKNDVSAVTVGLNFTPKGTRNRWQIDYVWRNERVDPVRNNMLQVQYQYFLTK